MCSIFAISGVSKSISAILVANEKIAFQLKKKFFTKLEANQAHVQNAAL
jgi:hypothetical protein